MIHLDSRLLSRLRRPVGRFDTELLGVLRVQPLPAAELHRLATNDAVDGSSAEKASQNIETNVPTRRDSGQAGKLRGHSALPGAEGYTRNQRAIAEPGVRCFRTRTSRLRADRVFPYRRRRLFALLRRPYTKVEISRQQSRTANQKGFSEWGKLPVCPQFPIRRRSSDEKPSPMRGTTLAR